MSAFAVQLDHLLVDLRALPSSTSSSQLAHVQHTVIRLERAYHELKRAGSHAPAVLFLRLRNRLEELAEGLDDAPSAGANLVSWDKLARDTAQVTASVDQLLAASSQASSAPSSSSHSRTPSVDLPRRLPASARQTTAPPPPSSDLDAFLSSTSASRTPSALDSSRLAAGRAHALSELYTLFQLSTSPGSVLPPGQSIRTIFRSSLPPPTAVGNDAAPPPTDAASLESRISTHLRRAYFDSFASTLSSAGPSPATAAEQSAAWARLAQDLVDAVVPLVPSRLKCDNGTPLRAHLAAALMLVPTPEAGLLDEAPTSATFDTSAALRGLREAVRALGRLCAPARDADVQALSASIDAALGESAPANQGAALVDAARRTLELASAMERDLARFRADAVTELASEDELVGVVREEAGARERALIGDWFEGEDGVKRETSAWCARALGRAVADAGASADSGAPLSKEDVAAALVEALFANEAVALPSFSTSIPASSRHESPTTPPPPPNILPPILLAVSPALYTLQNRLQALTILACLLALSPSADPARLWALLEGELAPSTSAGAPSAADEPARDPDPTPTRLAHLADELLRPLSAPSSPRSPSASAAPVPALAPGADEASRIRTSVDRLLRADDPVWRLLHGRLRAAVRDAVVRAVCDSQPDGEASEERVPGVLRTGRGARGAAEAERRSVRAPPRRKRAAVELAPVKGFEVPFVRDELRATVQDRLVGEVWEWVEEAWGWVLGWRTGEAGPAASAGP
ncbi:hypothetical protein JCM9279_004921 [Rhodotorula babjevae]